MKKLISFVFFALFSVGSAFSAEGYRLYGFSGYDTIFAEAGEQVEETYLISGDPYISSCEIVFAKGCFVNVLDNDTIILPQGDNAIIGQSVISGDKISYTFDKPWAFRQLFTLKGIMQSAPSNPYVIGSGQISFMMRAKIITVVGDTQTTEKMFTIRRVGKRTLEEIMSNGLNHVEYNGMNGYLIYCSSYTHGYFVSDSGVRCVVPWSGNGSWSSKEYTDAVTASWGWNMSVAKLVPSTILDKYRLMFNLVVKPGYCAFHSEAPDKYFKSDSFGVIKDITKNEATLYGAGKIVAIPDCFIVNYSYVSPTNISPKPQGKQSIPFFRGATGTGAYYSLDGRKISNASRAAQGLSIVCLTNCKMVKNMNLNRLR